jgi:hypothetical protein
MSTALKIRRGTTAEHASFTGVAGELTGDTTKNTVVFHNGTTPGGIPLAKESALASYLTLSGGTMTGALNEAAGSNVASAGTINLTTATGNLVHVTGTTTVTAITLGAGAERTVVFDGALTLTHGSSLLLPTAASITTSANDCAIFRGEASGVVRCIAYSRYDGTQVSTSGGVTSPRSIRQSVISGPVDNNGFPSFGGATGSTTVTASGTITVSASQGASDRTGSATNPSWTGLSTNGAMYLYIDVSSIGGCTTGSTTLKPTYRFGGGNVIVNGQNTFNIQEMTMEVGNGSTSAAVWRVFVGEVTVAGGVVSAITWYQLNGRYVSAETSLPSAGSRLSLNHNLGYSVVRTDLILICKTAEGNYSVGDYLYQCGTRNTEMQPLKFAPSSATSMAVTIGTSIPYSSINKTTGADFTLTAANWRIIGSADRSW